MADRSVVYRLMADVTQFRASMASAAASTQAAANKMTAATAEGEKYRRGLSTLGTVAGGIGLVAAAGLGAAIAKAANFDQAMSNVSAATHESAANMELLRAAALKAGADTAFSATEAAAGIENLAKAGVSTNDILRGGLTGALDLAAAGSIEVGAAAEAAASAMTQFNLKGTDVPHIADLLAAAAGKAQGEVSDMAMALNQSGLVAAQMGFSIEETTGSLAAFASAGLLGSDAGTSLKTMLLRLANPSAEAAETMERFGISAYDAQGNMRPMVEVAGQLQAAFRGQDQATRDAALATIFGSDAIRAANVLYRQGQGGIQGWIDKVNDQGYAAETAATKMDNLKGDLEALGGSLETALIGTGSGQQGALRGLVQSLTDVVNAYNKLPGAAQSGVGAFLGITAVIGGSVWAFSRIVRSVAATRAAMDQLGVSSGRAGAGLGSIATKAAGIAAVGIAIGAMTDSMGRIDTSKLDRSLEAMRQGGDTDTIDKIVDSLTELESWTNKVDLGEVFTGFGLFGDSTMDRHAQNIEHLDQALAGMVESGNAGKAAGAFEAFAARAREQGVGLDAVISRLPEYQTALGNAGLAAGGATAFTAGLGLAFQNTAGATGGAASGMDKVAGSASAAASATQGFKAAVEGLNAVLAGRAGMRDYQAAQDALRKQLRDNGNSFNINTAAGRENQAMLDDFVGKAVKVAEGMRGLERQKFLSGAITELRKFGRVFDIPQAEVQDLISLLRKANRTDAAPEVKEKGAKESTDRVKKLRDQIRLLKGKIVDAKEKGAKESSPRVKKLRDEIGKLKGKIVDAKQKGAEGSTFAVNNLRTAISLLHNKDVYIRVHRTGAAAFNAGQSLLPDGAGADGGTVLGAPRKPYGDKVLYALAPGEEIISNRFGQADRHRALLKAINSGRYAAGGGTAGGPRVSTSVNMAGALSGAQITAVFPGVGQVVGTIVDQRIEARDDMSQMRGRSGAPS